MPWVSKESLTRRIVDKMRFERGNLDNITPMTIETLIQRYERREKKTCDECVFGMYDDYLTEYEYYIPDK